MNRTRYFQSWPVSLALRGLASAAALSLASFGACAEAWPAKPIRMVVPYSPGGTSDYVARVIGNRLGQLLGQPVVVDNRPGAGAVIGTTAVAQSAADGYTLLLTAPEFTINPALQLKVSYDAQKDFAPVALFARYPHILVANPQVPAKNVRELVAYAKSRPGELNFASGGNGGSNHLSGEWFKLVTGAQMTHVPYKGNGPALTDLLANRVQLLFTGYSPVEAQIKSGQLRPLAVTGPVRLAAAPDVPTMIESGLADYDFTTWYGILAPANTPRAVIDRLNSELRKTLATPEVRDKLAGLGANLTVSSPEAYGTILQEETARWGKLVKATGIRIE